jgi:hypothetical protein
MVSPDRNAIFCFTLFFLPISFSYAQQLVLNGSVRDTMQSPLPSASVVVVNEKGTAIKFSLTNTNGDFRMSLQQEEIKSYSSLWIEVSYMGYKNQRKLITGAQSSYHFVLKKDIHTLKDVVIKKKLAIETMGDTLRYNVDQFSQTEDRSIADVLKRLPGIEVTSDGTVFYNGKKISDLYIGGDDLMSGRYGLATKTIRKDMIVGVDVIRNHQPIKVLKNKATSNNTAINLVLKDERSLKLSANTMVGLGSPKLYDVYVTPMLFNKQLKLLCNLGLNNSGVDYRNDLKQLGTSNFLADMENAAPDLILTSATIGPPDIPVSNYYFNKSRIININSLYNIKNGLQVKLNMQAFSDRNILHYTSKVDSYLQNDTIHYDEMQYYTNDPNLLRASANVMVNKDKLFFNNNIKVELENNNDASTLNFNRYNFAQSVTRQMKKFSNDINLMPLLKGKGIAELRWLINYNPNKQKLNIGKGYHSKIPGQYGYYDDVFQYLNLPTLYSHLFLGYKITGKVFNQSYRAGFIKESQTLYSLLNLVNGLDTIRYEGDSGNDLSWKKQNLYVSSDYEIRRGKLVSTIQLPVTYQNIHYDQIVYGVSSGNAAFLFNPYLNIRYDLTPERFVNGSYRYDNIYGDITGVYRGGILQNYRTFIANEANLQVRNRHSFELGYNFQKAVRMLFINTTLSFDKAEAATIMSIDIMNDIQKIVYLPLKNAQSQFSLKGGISKYLFDIKTTAAIQSQWSHSKYIRIVNDRPVPFKSNSLNLNARLQKKVFQILSINYEPNYLLNKAISDDKERGKNTFTNITYRFQHFLSLGVSPIKQLNIEATCKQSSMGQSGNNPVKYFFMDAKATYSNNARRIDLSLTITNLFNVKHYSLYSAISNQVVMSQYDIRGRMAIARLTCFL